MPVTNSDGTSRSRGFSLIELVMVMAIMVILLGAMQSLVFVASKSVPNRRTGAYAGVTAGIELDALEADLRVATMINVATSTALEMRVPDRDNDGLQETVRYEWSGTAGAPLQRKVTLSSTGLTATESLVAGVGSMVFTHDTLPTTAFRSTDTCETLLASYEPTATLTANNISSTALICQTVNIALPPSATSFRITRVALRLAVSGAVTGKTTVAVTSPMLGAFNLVALASATVSEDSLATGSTWVDFPMPTPPTIVAGVATGIALKVSSGSPSAAADALATGAPTGAGAMSRSSAGILWIAASGNALAYRIYGTFSTLALPAATNAPRYAGCTLKIMPMESNGNAPEMTFCCPNFPEAP